MQWNCDVDGRYKNDLMEIGPCFSSQQAEVGGAKCKANEQETEKKKKKEDRKHAQKKKRSKLIC